MMKYPNFYNAFFGPVELGFFLAALLFAFMGAYVSLQWQVNKRDLASDNTPVKFSYKFLFAHQLGRIIANIFLLFFWVRFTVEYIPVPWSLFLCVGGGFGSDRLMMIAQRFGYLTTNKAAEKIKEQLKPKDPEVIPKE